MFLFATGDFQSKSLLRLVDLKTEIRGTTKIWMNWCTSRLMHLSMLCPANTYISKGIEPKEALARVKNLMGLKMSQKQQAMWANILQNYTVYVESPVTTYYQAHHDFDRHIWRAQNHSGLTRQTLHEFAARYLRAVNMFATCNMLVQGPLSFLCYSSHKCYWSCLWHFISWQFHVYPLQDMYLTFLGMILDIYW